MHRDCLIESGSRLFRAAKRIMHDRHLAEIERDLKMIASKEPAVQLQGSREVRLRLGRLVSRQLQSPHRRQRASRLLVLDPQRLLRLLKRVENKWFSLVNSTLVDEIRGKVDEGRDRVLMRLA